MSSPLLWRPLQRIKNNIGAKTPFGTYYVETFGKRDPFWVEFRNIGFGGHVAFDTQEEAKAFAEEDYAERLFSARYGEALTDAMVMAGAKEAALWAGAHAVWEEHEALARRVLSAAQNAAMTDRP